MSRRKAESPSAFLPSFLADSSISQAEDNASPSLPVKPDNKIVTKVREVAAVDEKENQLEGSTTKPHRRVSQLRHSSPIKALQQRNPNSIEGIVLFISLEITVQTHKVSSGSEKFRVEYDCSLDQFKNCVSHKQESSQDIGLAASTM